jgi:hypothetical protein
MYLSNLERRTQRDLVELAELWCAATGNNLSATGRRAAGDARFFTNLKTRYQAGPRQSGDRQGAITTRVYDQIFLWLTDSANWPNGVAPNLEIADLTHHPKESANPDYPVSASELLAKLRSKIS